MNECIQTRNVEPDLSRPGYEFYLNAPDEDPEKIHRVEICFALK